MSRSRLSELAKDELKIALLFCDINLHFPSLNACFDHLNSIYHPIRDPEGVPAFLFRGEPGIYDTTHSRRTRIEIELWDRLEQGQRKLDELINYCAIKLSRLMPLLSQDEIMAFLQHYGLPTSGLDLTSELEIAAYFGSFGEPNRIKVIAAIDTEKLLRARGVLIGLNSGEFGSRPRKQHTYISCLDCSDNLKAPQLSRIFGMTWYSFILTEEDKYKFNSTKACLSEGDGSNMDLVASLITEYESLHGKIPRKLRRLLEPGIAKNRFSVR